MGIDYIQRARGIGEQLVREARELPDGSLTWGRGAGRQRQPVLDSGPFNGRCGEAFFLAALHHATGEESFKEAALKAIQGIERGLEGEVDPALLFERLSYGLSGMGGILYILVRMGQLLGREALLTAAERLSRLFTPEVVAADQDLDVVWGSAGALLSLLALADAGSEGALARAELCATHLASRRVADPATGLRAWKTLRPVPSSGFAHGSGGIAYALLQWYRKAGNEEYYRIALESFAFERSLYREDLQNWEESREEPEGTPMMWSWCHGAPGIGLSRLGALECLRGEDEGDIVQDLRQALRATIAARIPSVDTICCGYFGRVDVLLEAGRRLGNASLVREAQRFAELRLIRSDTYGFHTVISKDKDSPLLGGFWQGLAGIGYGLLRLERPDTYPCILAMA